MEPEKITELRLEAIKLSISFCGQTKTNVSALDMLQLAYWIVEFLIDGKKPGQIE